MSVQPSDLEGSSRGLVQFFYATSLPHEKVVAWRDFMDRVPWASYEQDPAWAAVDAPIGQPGVRQSYFCWAEQNGEICLVGLGLRRRLPFVKRAFWEFQKGPVFLEVEVFDQWLAWLSGVLRHDAARVQVEPPLPLEPEGDDVETILERRGFVRRRSLGTWSTLLVDLCGSEDDLFESLDSRTRRKIRQSRKAGIVVRTEDSPLGWRVLGELQRDLGRRTASVRPVDADTLSRISRQWLKGGAGGTILVAYRGDEPLAAGLVIVHGDKAYLPLLSSSPSVRDLPLSHLLVWEALVWAKVRGCTLFDLVGYRMLARPGDDLWGVNQFKRGFAQGRPPVKAAATHERVFSPALVAAAVAIRRIQARRSQS